MLTIREDPGHGNLPRLQLSALGHAVLTGALFLSAGVTFVVNMEFTRNIVNRWDLCIHSSGPNSLPSTAEAADEDWKQSQQTLTQSLNSLTVATQAQRSRLLEQHHEIRGVMNSHCLISHNFEIQFTSFTFVGTAAAILVTICLASVAPDGLKTKNRVLLNVMMSSSIILSICVIYPQTFSQNNNQSQAKSIYVQAANMMRVLNSTLANKEVATNPQNPKVFMPLNSTEAVATFIRMNDNALIQLTSARVSINNDFANRTFNQLNPGDSSTDSSGTSSPAAPAPAGTAAAVTTGGKTAP